MYIIHSRTWIGCMAFANVVIAILYTHLQIQLFMRIISTQQFRLSFVKPISQLRFDNDTTIRLRRKIDISYFACVELEAGARDTSYSRIVVESQL